MWFALVAVAASAAVGADEVVRLALERDIVAVSAAADVERAEGARLAAGGLRENPSVQGRWAVGTSAWEVEALQPLSLSGEGLADRRSATALSRSAVLEAEHRRLVVAADIRRLYARVVVAEADVDRTTSAFAVAARVGDAARAKLDAGEASEVDVRLASLDLARAAEDLLVARQAVTALRRELASRTGLDAEEELSGDPLDAAPDATGPAAVRPDLAAADERLDAFRSALGRERSELVPTVEVGAFAVGDDGSVAAGPLVQVEVPLWKHNPAGLADARADLAVAEADRRAIAAGADADVALAAALLATVAEVELALPLGVRTDAALALEAVEAAWSDGQIGFAEFGTLRLRILEGERAWHRARAELAILRIDALLAVADAALLGSD